MKHLLNVLTEQEKNGIREQYGRVSIKVNTESFNKLIESKLGDVKLMSEQIAIEPETPQQDNTKAQTFDFWKSRFDEIKNKLDSYFATIEGPVDVKRFQTMVNNTFFNMVGKVDDEFSYMEHGDEYQQLSNEYFSYFSEKLRELAKRFGKN